MDKARNPTSRLVELNKSLLDVSDLDEPTVKASVDKRCLRTPAEGVAMLDCAVGEKSASCFQVLHDDFVGFLDVLTSILLNLVDKLAVLIDRDWGFAWLDDAISNAGGIIVLTKAWSAVNNTGTSVLSDKATTKNLEAAISSSLLEIGEQRLVFLANKLLTLELLKDRVSLDFALLEDVLQASLHADVDLLSGGVLEAAVVHLGVDGEGKIGWEGPGGGRPSDEV